MTNFDPTKPCQTRDGRKVEILRVGVIDMRITAFVEDETNPSKWVLRTYHCGGWFLCPVSNMIESFCADDLVNVPAKVKREGWVNIYKIQPYGPPKMSVRTGGVYSSKIDAHRGAVHANSLGTPLPVATVKIEWEEEV